MTEHRLKQIKRRMNNDSNQQLNLFNCLFLFFAFVLNFKNLKTIQI